MTETESAVQQDLGVWRRLARAVRWLLAAMLVALTIDLVLADLAPFKALVSVAVHVLITMVLLIALNQWLMSCRFALIMRHCAGVELSAWRWFQLTSVGQFLNLFVPQLGHVYRGVVLQREAQLSYPAYATGLLVFLWFEVVMGTVMAVLVVSIHDPRLRLARVYVLLPLLAGLGVLAGMPYLVSAVVGKLRLKSPRIVAGLKEVRESLLKSREVLGRWSVLVKYIALSLVVVAEHVALLAIAFGASGERPDFSHLILFQVLLKLSGLVLITPGNLGVTELAYGALAGAASASVQHGIAASVLIRVVGTGVFIFLGLAMGGGSALVKLRRERRSRPG